MIEKELIIRSFPSHHDNIYKVYNIYKGLSLIIHPVIHQGCTTECYQDISVIKQQIYKQKSPPFCKICGNEITQKQLIYDIGFKNVLEKCRQRLRKEMPLYIKINPFSHKILFSPQKKDIEEEMAYSLYKEYYQKSLLYLRQTKLKKCSLKSVKQQIRRNFRVLKDQKYEDIGQFVYSFCRGPTSLPQPTLLLFFSTHPHKPISYTIEWVNAAQQQIQPLNNNFNHNAVITLLSIQQSEKYLLIGISGKKFHIFVASFNQLHDCIDNNKKIIRFFLAKEFSYKRQYPSIYTNHISKHIYILGGFSESQQSEAVKTDIFIYDITWKKTDSVYKPQIKYVDQANIFPSVKVQTENLYQKQRQHHDNPILRGFSLTNSSPTGYQDLSKKLECIRRNGNPVWFSVGGQSKSQVMVKIQSPSFRKIHYKGNTSVNPVQELNVKNHQSPELSCFYPIITEFPIVWQKRDKSLIDVVFLLRNTHIPLQQTSKNSQLLALLVFLQKPVKIHQIRKFKNKQIAQNIQSNGDNFMTLLYDKGKFYLRTNLSFKKPLISRVTNKQIHYLSLQFFIQEKNYDTKIKEGYI